MADRRTKLVLASVVMVSAVGGSLMFCRPTASEHVAATPAAAPSTADMGLRHRVEPAPPPTETQTTHLLGKIEPQQVPAPAAPADSMPPQPRAKARPATSRHAYEVGELPPPMWNPLHPHAGDRPVVHRVCEGETLSGIARRYLGSADRYTDLFAANRNVLRDPDQLRAGMELLIPGQAVNNLPPPAAAPARSAEPESAVLAANSSGQMVPITPGSWRRSRQHDSTVRQYRVRADDTLVDIAKQFYGDPSRFQELYEANRDRLASPEQLREGMMLVIP